MVGEEKRVCLRFGVPLNEREVQQVPPRDAEGADRKRGWGALAGGLLACHDRPFSRERGVRSPMIAD
jgi:hypothetical protein